jgi:DNA-binding response OmpR family regulator
VTNAGRVLLADSNADVAAAVTAAAAHKGIRLDWCLDGGRALIAVGAEPPSVLVLSARLGVVDPPKIVSTVRDQSDVPILIGAGPHDEDIARVAVEAGATAVIERPYDIGQITSFVDAARAHHDEPTTAAALLIAGPISVDRRGHRVHVRGREVSLTNRELALLAFLVERRGRVADQDEISHAVWGHPTDTNTVAVHVKRLRVKLGEDPELGQFITTIRGVGYRLAPSLCA